MVSGSALDVESGSFSSDAPADLACHPSVKTVTDVLAPAVDVASEDSPPAQFTGVPEAQQVLVSEASSSTPQDADGLSSLALVQGDSPRPHVAVFCSVLFSSQCRTVVAALLAMLTRLIISVWDFSTIALFGGLPHTARSILILCDISTHSFGT